MKRFICILFSLPLLTSCSFGTSFVFEEYDHSFYKENVKENHEQSSYYQLSTSGSYSLPFSVQGVDSIDSYYSLKKLHENKHIYPNPQLEPIELNLLVVPISYKDSPSHSSKEGYQTIRDNYNIMINNAFFGSKNHNSYYSVSEYYNRSSYGNIILKGEVTPFYEVDKTTSELVYSSGTRNVSMDNAKKILVDISNWLRSEEYPGEKIDLKKYDSDNDNFIDGIYLLYDFDSATREELKGEPNNHFFWQVNDKVTTSYIGLKGQKQLYTPYISDYSWSSLDEERLGTIGDISNSSYYIHETGHLFGLDDYYNTNGYDYTPTGYLDMMDYNIGDHTAFSKYLLNWTTPKVLTDEGEITISPFIESGDFILIPSNLDNYKKHNSPYDEYLLLEYFAPTSLNTNEDTYLIEFDNGKSLFKYLNKHGLKVYHVDARLAYYNASKRKVSLIEDTISSSNLGSVYFAYDNSSKTNPVLYHLLESSGENTFINGAPGGNDTLFKTKDTFGIDTFKDFKFNNGYSLSYSFEIKRMGFQSITISFKKL